MSRLIAAEPRLKPPFVHAESMTRCFLYWAPHDFQRAKSATSQWYNAFFDAFAARIAKEQQLIVEYFLHIGVLQDEWHHKFVKHAPQLMPIGGMGVTPGTSLPPAPSEKSLQAIIKQEKKFVAEDWLPPYVYWLLDRSYPVRKEFFSSGGVSLLFLPAADSPVAHVKVPNVARKMVPGMDINGIMGQLNALSHPFSKKSKELFGKPYQDQLGYEGWLFLFPLLHSKDFFSLPEQVVADVLELTPIYMNESPEDSGLIIASKEDLEETLNAVIQELEESGNPFPSEP